ncbi:MAG: hypothetical protein JWM57_4140 [Phycisphaerales bacterium]|nr:hypothetical protein [Phycisphaerales bacterium]
MQRWRTVAAAGAAVLAGVASWASAADLPTAVRTAASSDADKPNIETYVKNQIAKISSGTGAGVARDELARQPEPTTTVIPSASFQSAYAQAVITDITPLLADSDVNKRLNAAIVIYRVANASKANQFAPLAQKLMDDASPAVAIWGVKAAGSLLPSILSVKFNRDKQTLTKAIVASAKKHTEAGPLVQDAYNALFLPDQTPPLPKDAYGPAIDAMNELMAARLDQYAKGLPASPQADRIPPIFFVRGGVTSAMTPAQQMTTLQHMLDLLSLAAQRTATLGGDQRDQTIQLVKSIAGAMRVTLDASKQGVAAVKFEPLSKLRDPIQTPAVVKQVAEALNATSAVPAFKALKDAPQIEGGGCFVGI